jgi:hypothetical protein
MYVLYFSRFYNQRELKGHRSKHAAKGEYWCEICDIHFVEEGSLQAHYHRLHVSYNCLFCSEKFSNKKCLRQHTYRIHKEETKVNKELAKTKKMNCSICAKTLCNKWRLEYHLIKKHNIHKTTITENGYIHFKRRKFLKHSSDMDCVSENVKKRENHLVETVKSSNEECSMIDSSELSLVTSDDTDEKSDHSYIDNEVTVTNTLDERNETTSTRGHFIKMQRDDIFSDTCDARMYSLENKQDKSYYNKDVTRQDRSPSSANKVTNSDNIRQNVSPQHGVNFKNSSECESERQCRIDIIEADQLIESNTMESLELLQHEFDDVDDVGAEDDVEDSVQDDVNIAGCHIRPSSAALQEYFMRYSQKVESRDKRSFYVINDRCVKNN